MGRSCASPICRCAVPLDSVKHYEDYIARLHQIPRALTESEETLRAGMKDKLMPVRFLLEKIPAQCDGVIAADPFLLPTKKFPASISAEDQQRLTKAITEAVNNEVFPAYQGFAAFIATEYAPQGRTNSERRLAAGRQRALSQRHPQPYHGQHPEPGSDSRDRFARDRAHSGRDARHCQSPGLCGCGLVSRVAENQRASTSRLPPNRSSMTSASTLRRCSPSFRSCSASSPARR